MIFPEPVVEGSRQQEAENLCLAGIVEATEEEHGIETSTRSSRGSLTSQSSTSSPRHVDVSLNNNSGGVMINRNVGNRYKTIFKNVGNNNSVKKYYR
jgi:hypothetical protein